MDVLLAVVTVLGIVILLLEDERNAAVAAAAQLEHMAGHDALTGLPNRLMLLERTSQALRRAVRDQRSVAVLTLDLDGFKLLNDSLGHALGDELLRSVGARLKGAVRDTDTVARLSGTSSASSSSSATPTRRPPWSGRSARPSAGPSSSRDARSTSR